MNQLLGWKLMGPRVYMHLEDANPSLFVGRSGSYCGISPATLLSVLRKGRLVAICAEPGYCSSGLVREMLELGKRAGCRTFYRDCSSISGEASTDQVSRLARDVMNKTRGTEDEVLACIDWIAPSDEVDVALQARSIARMLNRGVAVLVTMLPEARQLLEQLRDHVLLTSDGLSDQVLSRVGSGIVGESVQESLTYGIPALSVTFASEVVEGCSGPVPPGYSRALCDLANLSLRPILCDEERSLRFSMALLGEGSFEDIRSLVGGSCEEYLSDMAAWAPFFGVDEMGRKFRCVTTGSLGWLSLEPPAFASFAKEQEGLFVACAQLLGSRGDYARVAALLVLGSPKAQLSIVSEWGPELLDWGYIGLLSDIVSTEEATSAGKGGQLWCLRRAIEALGCARPEPSSQRSRLQALSSERLSESSQLSLAFSGIRARLKGCVPNGLVLSSGDSDLQHRLTLHNTACDLLLAGKFADALRVLAEFNFDGEIETVSECLLRIDLDIARVFACDCKWDDRSSMGRCRDYLSSRGYLGLLGYSHLQELALEALGSNPAGTVGAIRSQAAKAGDTLVLVAAQVAESLMLLRMKPSAYILANIQSAKARCADVGWEYASRVAEVFEQIAQSRLGGSPGLYEVERGDGLAEVSNLVHDAICDVAEDVAPRSGRIKEVPRDELWLYISLIDGMGEFSVAIFEQMPAEWRRAVEVARRNCAGAVEIAAPKSSDDVLMATGGVAPYKTVRANLFGDFSLWVGEARVSDWAISGRNAKTVIECLSLQKGYLSNRVRLARLIWSNVETELQANQRIYAATARIRKALACHGFEDELFVMNRTTRTLALAADLFECDVDEFEARARDAVESADDARSCAAALKVESLYAGDLCVLGEDPKGYLATQRDRLRELYVEAMVSGADSALKLGRKRLAARLANNALASDPMREDAMVLLVKALRTSGRESEATRRFQGYAKLLAKHKRVPSPGLQETLDEPMGEAAGEQGAQHTAVR